MGMKVKRIKKILLLISLLASISIVGCTEKEYAKIFGGTITVELEPNMKLEEVTWKEGNIWYLTRPMREGEEPEIHYFKEDSQYGIMEGTVVIKESEK